MRGFGKLVDDQLKIFEKSREDHRALDYLFEEYIKREDVREHVKEQICETLRSLAKIEENIDSTGWIYTLWDWDIKSTYNPGADKTMTATLQVYVPQTGCTIPVAINLNDLILTERNTGG